MVYFRGLQVPDFHKMSAFVLFCGKLGENNSRFSSLKVYPVVQSGSLSAPLQKLVCMVGMVATIWFLFYPLLHHSAQAEQSGETSVLSTNCLFCQPHPFG